MLLKSFKLKQEYRGMPVFNLKFKEGLNVIVGDNGSGKSSLLELITMGPNKLGSISIAPGTEYRFLDTERMNPRIKSSFADSKYIAFDLACRFRSHGESMLPLIMGAKDFKNILLLIDEPDAGISLKAQLKVLKIMEDAVKNGCQVVLTTHSYVIIKSVPEVFCMDTRTWMPSTTYLKRVGL